MATYNYYPNHYNYCKIFYISVLDKIIENNRSSELTIERGIQRDTGAQVTAKNCDGLLLSAGIGNPKGSIYTSSWEKHLLKFEERGKKLSFRKPVSNLIILTSTKDVIEQLTCQAAVSDVSFQFTRSFHRT